MIEFIAAAWVLSLKTDPIDDVTYARATIQSGGYTLIVGCGQSSFGQLGFNILMPRGVSLFGETRVTARFDGLRPNEYIFSGSRQNVSPERQEKAFEIISSLKSSRQAIFRVHDTTRSYDVTFDNISGAEVLSQVEQTCLAAKQKNE